MYGSWVLQRVEKSHKVNEPMVISVSLLLQFLVLMLIPKSDRVFYCVSQLFICKYMIVKLLLSILALNQCH